MRKIIFILIAVVSIIFASCNAPTEVRTISASGIESSATFTDFFYPVELVYASKDETSTAIVMDKNTGVIYIWKRSGYQWGMSPIYDSDGSVLTQEKWLARQVERKN